MQPLPGRNTTISEFRGKGTAVHDIAPGLDGPDGGGNGPGACCFPSGCTIATRADCEAAGGIYEGQGTDCTACGFHFGIPGACCLLATGACIVTDFLTCHFSGGSYRGEGTTCPPSPGCVATGNGACCAPGGGCTITDFGSCSGTWHSGSSCDGITCLGASEPDGACCQTADGQCSITTFPDCHGIYFGDFTSCSWVGACTHAWCGPTNYLCSCPPNPFYPDQIPAPVCCPMELELCETCVSFGVVFCCCCHDGPFGRVCL